MTNDDGDVDLPAMKSMPLVKMALSNDMLVCSKEGSLEK
jgi:hypothetical protein